jgi:hypothetical protein
MGPKCAVHEAEIVELRAGLVEIKASQSRLEMRTTEEFLNVFGALSRVETKINRLIEGVAIGQIVRSPAVSLDWELDEPTMHGREDPTSAAWLWALRAREAAERADALQAELLSAKTAAAAATARCEERARHSDRVRADEVRASDMSIAKWKLIAGLVATVLTSGGIAALLAQMLGG